MNVLKNRWNVDWHGSYDCGRPHSTCVRTYAVKITKLSPDVGPYKFTHTHTHTHTHTFSYRSSIGDMSVAQGNRANLRFLNHSALYFSEATWVENNISLWLYFSLWCQLWRNKPQCTLCTLYIRARTFRSRDQWFTNTPRTRRCDQWCISGINRKDCMSWIFISCVNYAMRNTSPPEV